MRVIGGKYRGHKLVAFQASHIRPTTDRVKETIFNMLSFHIEDESVLDLFSGTGSLGIEALSRGAKDVTFVESQRKSIDILNSNLNKLKITENFKIFKSDVFLFLQKNTPEQAIILVDPPFTEKLAHKVMIALGDAVGEGVRFICIESLKQEQIEDVYGQKIKLFKRKDYGDKYLSVYKCNSLIEDEVS